MTATQPPARRSRYPQVRRVLGAVLAANLIVSAAKLMLGFITGALAVLADGFHSLVDSSSNLIGLAAIRLAARPPDERHPYGYRKYETIGALAIGGLLLVAAYEIAKSIVERLGSGQAPLVSPLTFWLIALTLPVNLVIYLLERRAGRRLASEILLADAEHTRTDLYITASVIAGLAGTWLGWGWLDLLVAAVVIVFILRAAYRILRESAGWLTDAVVADAERVDEITRGVPGVAYVHHIRSRGTPASAFVDLHVKVDPGMSTEQAHAIASEVETRLRRDMPVVVDALVHIEPARQPQASLMERIAYDLRQIADGMALGIHDLHVQADGQGGYLVELHLEMRGSLSLGEAHALADEFERRVREIAARPVRLITHLEPIPDTVLPPDPAVPPELHDAIRRVITDLIGSRAILELQTHRHPAGISVAARVCLPPRLSLNEAHNAAEQIERALLTQFPRVHRVTVHMEPERP
jgi:cation diffusion facilitator family transporter